MYGHVDERATAEIRREWQAAVPGESCEIVLAHCRGEAFHRVVAGVDLHQQRGARTDGGLVVAQVGAVRGPHLHELRARPLHDVRHAERPADLDQLASRDRDLLALRQGVEDQQHRRRVVVDDDRRLRGGEPAQPRLHVPVPITAPSRLEVELEIAGAAGHRRHRRHGLLRQRCAPQVGVQHRSREVDQGDQRRRDDAADADRDGRIELLPADGAAGGDGRAGLVERSARRFEHERAAVLVNEGRDTVLGEQPIHGGKLGERGDACHVRCDPGNAPPRRRRHRTEPVAALEPPPAHQGGETAPAPGGNPLHSCAEVPVPSRLPWIPACM